MPSFSINTSWNDEYDADDGNSSKSRASTNGDAKGNVSARSLPTPSSRREKLPQSEKKRSMEEDESSKSVPVAASRMKLRSSSKKKKDEAVILRRSERVSFNDSKFVLRKPNIYKNRRSPSKQQATLTQVSPSAPYPPRPLKSPSKCPVSAIQLPLPFRLFSDKSNSNQLADTLINFREPLSYADTPPVSPGISHLRHEHSDNSRKTTSLVDLDSSDKIYDAHCRKIVFAGKNCSPEPSLEDSTQNKDDEIANKHGEIHWLNVTQLCDGLSRLNLKSAGAQYKADTKEEYEIALDEEVARKMEILLDLSYLKSRVHHISPPPKSPHDIPDSHRKRIILILKNPSHAKILISIILRNNKGIDVEELMRHFDYFSEN